MKYKIITATIIIIFFGSILVYNKKVDAKGNMLYNSNNITTCYRGKTKKIRKSEEYFGKIVSITNKRIGENRLSKGREIIDKKYKNKRKRNNRCCKISLRHRPRNIWWIKHKS